MKKISCVTALVAALLAILPSCDKVGDRPAYVSVVSSGTGRHSFRLWTDVDCTVLTVELARKPSEGPYRMEYLIDGDDSAVLDGFVSGESFVLAGFDTRKTFVLPALQAGTHGIDGTLWLGNDSQSASLQFETQCAVPVEDGVPCGGLAVAMPSSVYEGTTVEFVVSITPEGCTDQLSYSISDESVLRIRHDLQWDQWYMSAVRPGTAEVIFSCGSRKVRKTVSVIGKI